MKFHFWNKQQKDITKLCLVLGILAFVAVKLILCSAQKMFVDPEGATLDDTLMYNMAVSITEGNWLGAYDWTTLSKHSFFALWLAVLHTLHIPYLMGGQLLWAAANSAAALAVYPVLKKKWLSLLLFLVLLFNPASTANPAPYGFVLRVYRDNIFPALCLLCIAGVLGMAFRYRQKASRSVGWASLAGVSLAAAYLTREDGWWLLPFVIVAAVVMLVFILRSKETGKLRRAVLLLLPFLLLAAGDIAWRTVNYQVYGRFIISDFSSGEFADAYGAMTRIEHENWEPKNAVPYDVRQKLYANVPAFAELEETLESADLKSQYGGEEYSSGGFYWALREAAALHGYYDTPQAAQAYFEGLARDINALCDAGVLPAGPARSSVSPPIRAEYIGPVLREGLYDFYYCATFKDCDARSLFSPRSNDPALYEPKIRPMEEFLHDKAQTITIENSDEPYFLLREKIAFAVFDSIRWLYAVALPLALLAALAWQCAAGVQLVRRIKKRQRDEAASLLWIVQLGLLFCALLRVFMIAFVTVSSFQIDTYIMYLASVHPLLLMYGFLGAVQAVVLVKNRRALPKGGVA